MTSPCEEYVTDATFEEPFDVLMRFRKDFKVIDRGQDEAHKTRSAGSDSTATALPFHLSAV